MSAMSCSDVRNGAIEYLEDECLRTARYLSPFTEALGQRPPSLVMCLEVIADVLHGLHLKWQLSVCVGPNAYTC